MIYTDRQYNRQQEISREEYILRLEQERDKLADRMFDSPGMCTTANINRLNYLNSQIEIMQKNKIIHY